MLSKPAAFNAPRMRCCRYPVIAAADVASFAIDEADATTIIADYALGGGASAFAAMHDKAGTDSDLTTVGLNFAF